MLDRNVRLIIDVKSIQRWIITLVSTNKKKVIRFLSYAEV